MSDPAATGLDATNTTAVNITAADVPSSGAPLEMSLRILHTPAPTGAVSDRSSFDLPRIESVPEPATLFLVGSGLLGLMGVARRRRGSQG